MARNCLEIRLDLIRKNFRTINQAVSPLNTMAVLKANAYGVGAIPVCDALRKEGCVRFGVADVVEALEIGDGKSDIYILGDILPEEVSAIVENDFIAPITSLQNAHLLNTEALRRNKVVRCQILLDTGMGRLGLLLDNCVEEMGIIAQLPGIKIHGLYSHFPHAYDDEKFSNTQIVRLRAVLAKLAPSGIDFKEVHIANSDGIHNIKQAVSMPFNLVRTGINLYGCFDLEGQRTLKLNPVIRLTSKLVAVRQLPDGHSVGYGRTYILSEKKTIGTVAIGYADGLPISLSNNGFLIVRGVKCPIIGRVSMDYTTIDLTKAAGAQPGDEVICLGDTVSVSDWAELDKTITYDIICSIGARVKRVYID